MDSREPLAAVEACVDLDAIRPGSQSVVQVMVCRRWDVTNSYGKFRGTEYILSDNKGNVIQCSARSNISHCFATTLNEGAVYSIQRFTVSPNKKKFRIRNTDEYTIDLEGYSVVKKLDCALDGFVRYPFQLVPLGEIVLNDSLYLIDVIGCATDVGKVRTTPTGSELLDVYLVDQSGTKIRSTLWGTLCNTFLQGLGVARPPYVVVLTSMNVKFYSDEMYLSSTSATFIYDDCVVPQISDMRTSLSTVDPLDRFLQPPPPPTQAVTVANLLRIGLEQRETRRQTMVLHCKARIAGIRGNDSWFYYSCGFGRCKKRLDRLSTGFWCKGCKKGCDYPRPRFRIQLNVEDNTAVVVLTLFDEVAEIMLKKTAAMFLEGSADDSSIEAIPEEIQNLVGGTHVFEIKTHSHFTRNGFVSFSVNKIIVVDDADTVGNVCSKRARDASNDGDALLVPKRIIVDPTTVDTNLKAAAGTSESSDTDNEKIVDPTTVDTNLKAAAGNSESSDTDNEK